MNSIPFGHRFFLAAILSLLISMQPSRARAQETATASDAKQCSTFLELVQSSSTWAHWKPQSTVFEDSVSATVVSSVFWLAFVEALRQSGDVSAILNPTFARTTTVDSIISVISHRIGVGDLPSLQKVLGGSWAKSPAGEFAARVGANSILNAAVISIFWATTGVDVSVKEVLGALALCGGVYTGLQFFNNFFYKVYPLKRDCQTQACLVQELGDKVAPVLEAARENGQKLQLSDAEIEFLLISNLEAAITSKPYEVSIKNTPELRSALGEDSLLSSLEKVQKNLLESRDSHQKIKLAQKEMKLRRKLIDRLLDSVDRLPANLRNRVKNLLSLGPEFSAAESLRFHQIMRERAKTYHARIRAVSFLKQALAVGLAGGVFLYNTTYWATYGRWPGF